VLRKISIFSGLTCSPVSVSPYFVSRAEPCSLNEFIREMLEERRCGERGIVNQMEKGIICGEYALVSL
jgi:hypothetical protein